MEVVVVGGGGEGERGVAVVVVVALLVIMINTVVGITCAKVFPPKKGENQKWPQLRTSGILDSKQ